MKICSSLLFTNLSILTGHRLLVKKQSKRLFLYHPFSFIGLQRQSPWQITKYHELVYSPFASYCTACVENCR